jgi:hypothetical protein
MAKNQDLRFEAGRFPPFEAGLLRLIFTFGSLRPYALGSSAGRFTEYDHVVEAVPSQNVAAGET